MNESQKYIYADNAATTPLDPEAYEAMIPFLRENFGNPSSPYSFSRASKKAIEKSRETIAQCIGAAPEEIYFTSGGTESNNWVIHNFTHNAAARGRKILISAIEHHAIINCAAEAKRIFNTPYEIIPVDNNGIVIQHDYCQALSDSTAGVSIMLANNEIGVTQDIARLAGEAKKYNIPFHTDAVQAIGHIPIDVKALDIDFLSASAHKFNGPKGTGFLYVKNGYPLIPLISGGGQQSGLRAGTENVPAIVGMATALKNNCCQIQQNITYLKQLENSFKEYLSHYIPEVSFIGNSDYRLPGHISVSIPRVTGESLIHLLDLQGIAISTGAACNTKSTEISHVLKAIALPDIQASNTVRVTFGKINSLSDPIVIAQKINSIYRKFPV